jgi:hypothetical protein
VADPGLTSGASGAVPERRARPITILGRLDRIDLPGGAAGPGWAWWCPGCLSYHAVDGRWHVTDAESNRPTIVPSVVVHAAGGGVRCHSLIRAGLIEFFSDCDHPWAGNVLPMEAFEPLEDEEPGGASAPGAEGCGF